MRDVVLDFNSVESNSESNSVERNSDSNSNSNYGNSNSNTGNSNSIPIPVGLGKANSIPIPIPELELVRKSNSGPELARARFTRAAQHTHLGQSQPVGVVGIRVEGAENLHRLVIRGLRLQHLLKALRSLQARTTSR